MTSVLGMDEHRQLGATHQIPGFDAIDDIHPCSRRPDEACGGTLDCSRYDVRSVPSAVHAIRPRARRTIDPVRRRHAHLHVRPARHQVFVRTAGVAAHAAVPKANLTKLRRVIIPLAALMSKALLWSSSFLGRSLSLAGPPPRPEVSCGQGREDRTRTYT